MKITEKRINGYNKKTKIDKNNQIWKDFVRGELIRPVVVRAYSAGRELIRPVGLAE